MSRIGKQLITIPSGVEVKIEQGKVTVKGPKGTLERVFHPLVTVLIEGSTASVSVPQPEDGTQRALWGTHAAHLKNMVEGVVKGFEKKLEVNGVGYRVAMQGKDVRLEVGFSHPVVYTMPSEVTAAIDKNVITLTSADIEKLGKTASEIRAIKKPEPYKGKGIKYVDEVLRRKAGKSATAGKE